MNRSTAGYAFDNDSAYAWDHHNALSRLLDDSTRQRINALVNPLAGRRCAEVAAGAGSIAFWLADQVGVMGQVLATDINPGLIKPREHVVVLTHDITHSSLPGDGYDLIHARLLLNHLGQRVDAAAHMILSLRPGGVLLIEDFVPADPHAFVQHAPSPTDADLLRRVGALYLDILRGRGTDWRWSLQAPGILRGLGLYDVQTTVLRGQWAGGGPGCRMLDATLAQLREEIAAAGMSPDALNRVHQLLHNPSVVLTGYDLHSISARLAGRPS